MVVNNLSSDASLKSIIPNRFRCHFHFSLWHDLIILHDVHFHFHMDMIYYEHLTFMFPFTFAWAYFHIQLYYVNFHLTLGSKLDITRSLSSITLYHFFISMALWEVISITFFLLLVEHLMLYLHVFINLPCGNMFFHNCLSSSITHSIMPQTRIQYTSAPYIFSYKFLALYLTPPSDTFNHALITPWCPLPNSSEMVVYFKAKLMPLLTTFWKP